ncbi:MAG: hypothetical protein WCI93_00660 [bacterium]
MKKFFFIAMLAILIVGAFTSCKKEETNYGLNGWLNQPTVVVSETTPAQYVPCGDGGSINEVRVTYNFSSEAEAIITDLKFSVEGLPSVVSLRIAGMDFVCMNGVVEASGLSIKVSRNSNGVNMPVYVSYGPIGPVDLKMTSSGTTTSIKMISVKYQSGDGRHVNILFVSKNSSPTMTLVMSVPHIVMSQPNHYFSTVHVGSVEIADVTITGDSKGAISVGEIGLIINSKNVSFGQIYNANIYINDPNGSRNIVETASYVSLDSENITMFQLKGNNMINHNASITYRIYMPVIEVGQNSSVEVSMNKKSFAWYDLSSGERTGSQEIKFDGNLLSDFPTNISVVTN